MSAINVLLVGYGKVGKAFFRLIQEKQDYCRHQYDLEPKILAIFRKHGAWYSKNGLGQEQLDERHWHTNITIEEALARESPGVLVECVASPSQTGQPGLDVMVHALSCGWHVVTADKGPLVAGMKELQNAANENHVKLKISGATAAALPTLDVGINSLAGTEIKGIQGILNGTCNYILSRMQEGMDYALALKRAQAQGIAEPDPGLDVKGWDSAYKLLLITNSVFNQELELSDIEVTGITQLSREELDSGVSQGKKLKLMAIMEKREKCQKLKVAPVWLESNHPLAHVDGTNKGISFETDTMGSVTVTGGKSDPRGAAAALFKDIINIYRKC